MTAAFKQFRPMIEGAAWTAHKKYKMDIEELRSQAYFVFCEAIERYDPNKASFSTHLFSRLRTVKDFAKWECKENNTEAIHSIDEETYLEKDMPYLIDKRVERFEEAINRLETALDLSDDAQEILNFILGREWETPGINRVPRLHSIKKYYKYWKGWSHKRVVNAWEEIRIWWHNNNHFLQET